MCIAIAKLEGQKFPSDAILRNCFDNNPDGAGFAYPVRNGVRIQKGYMTWDAFKAALDRLKQHVDVDNIPMLLHFRIATHGTVDGAMTHPFPINYDEGALKKTDYVSDYAVIHNGIISMCSTGYKSVGLSDTAIFIKDYLTLIATNPKWNYSADNMNLIEKLIGSKMAVLDKCGHISHTEGFEVFEGNMYSNTTYKENRKTYTKYHSYDYDDYDDYYGSGGYYFNSRKKKKYSGDTYITDDHQDILDFLSRDSEFSSTERALMQIEVGQTLSVDGMDYYVETQAESDMLYIDRMRDVWERVSQTVPDEENGFADITVGYNHLGSSGRVYDKNGMNVKWNGGITVSEDLFM